MLLVSLWWTGSGQILEDGSRYCGFLHHFIDNSNKLKRFCNFENCFLLLIQTLPGQCNLTILVLLLWRFQWEDQRTKCWIWETRKVPDDPLGVGRMAVMVMGGIVYGVHYTLQEYLCTFLVAGGVSVFALNKVSAWPVLHSLPISVTSRHFKTTSQISMVWWMDGFLLGMQSSSSPSRVAIPNASLGYSLCLINLACDGFTNASQDSLTARSSLSLCVSLILTHRSMLTSCFIVPLDLVKEANYCLCCYGGNRYPGVNAWHIMMGMNFWGTLYMSLFLFLVPGAGGYPALSFCVSNPDVSWDIFWFCICGAVGQNFIFLTISHFGALTNTTVTTTRKFMSILMSSIWNKNRLSMQQWGGVCMVFGGLSFQIWLAYQKKRQKAGKQIRVPVETRAIDKARSHSPTSPRARSPISQRGRSSNSYKGQNRNH